MKSEITMMIRVNTETAQILMRALALLNQMTLEGPGEDETREKTLKEIRIFMNELRGKSIGFALE
jgi:hypothetical protein